MRRYNRSMIVKGGRQYGTAKGSTALYYAAKQGAITCTRRVTKEGDRLDIIAGELWGDSTLWWVIAACSGIGWGPQIPPAVVLSIPTDIAAVQLYV